MATVDITDETFAETIQNSDIVFIDIWTSWCGPYHQFAPIYEEALEKYSEVVFARLDTDANQEASAALGIRSIPTLFVLREGILLLQHSGVLPETTLSDLVGRASELNTDDIRAQIAEQVAQSSATE